MAYTNPQAVAGILADDYNLTTDLQQFIDTADIIIQRVKSCAAARRVPLTPIELEMIERWLAAHMYCMSSPQYQSEATGGISVSYTGQTGLHIESTRFGQMAINLDYSGCLNAISSRSFARANWLGTDDCNWPVGP